MAVDCKQISLHRPLTWLANYSVVMFRFCRETVVYISSNCRITSKCNLKDSSSNRRVNWIKFSWDTSCTVVMDCSS